MSGAGEHDRERDRPRGRGRGARILVVDDEPGLRRSVQRVLGTRYDLLVCATPEEALARVDAFGPDIAILDVRMPGMDGFELMAALKARDPRLDVILMTGSATEPDQKLIRSIREEAFYFLVKPFDREVVETLVERCLTLRRLSAENRRHLARLEAELAAGRAFQHGLLPPLQAVVEGVRIDAHYAPCVELGGDIYDYSCCGPGRCALMVADVSGHGVSAAMLTAVVTSAFRAALSDGGAPGEIARRVRDAMAAFEPTRYVTLFAAQLDARAGTLTYVNAAHPPPVLWARGGAPRRLEPTGTIVSPAFQDATWDEVRIVDLRGARLLAMTDGLLDAEDATGVPFGAERVTESVVRRPDGGTALLESILADLRAFTAGAEAGDDVTLVTASLP